eukprot:gene21775-24693_t
MEILGTTCGRFSIGEVFTSGQFYKDVEVKCPATIRMHYCNVEEVFNPSIQDV